MSMQEAIRKGNAKPELLVYPRAEDTEQTQVPKESRNAAAEKGPVQERFTLEEQVRQR